MDILIILFLTFLSGVFSMTEIALVSSRRLRLEHRVQAGSKGALAALRLLDNPTRFFSTIQMGNTTIALLNGIVGEGAFGADLGKSIETFGLSPAAASAVATLIVVVVVTYITIVFGELVAKRIGQTHPESIACWMARPVAALALVASPFVALLAHSTNLVLRLIGISGTNQQQVTEAEIQASLMEGVHAGVIEKQEHQMVRNVFLLDDRQLASIMVPRSSIEWLDAQLSVEQALQQAWPTGHSWYPVCRDGLNDVVGVVHLPALLALQRQGDQAPLSAHVKPAVFVPESLSGMELLEQFRQRAARMVFVVDEYGEVQGVLTPLDLLEAITGELSPQHSTDAWAIQRPDGCWEVDGAMPVAELKARLGIEDLPEEDKGRYNTVAGLMQAIDGRLLLEGEAVDCAGWQFEVQHTEGRRIDRVLIRPLKLVL